MTRAAPSPPVGQSRTFRGQKYRCLAVIPHTCRDGHITELAVWGSTCAASNCDVPFDFATPKHSAKFKPNRRCGQHHRPGRPVDRERRRHVDFDDSLFH